MTGEPSESAVASGFLEPRVRAEFPGLALAWTVAPVVARSSSHSVRQRLRHLSNRFHGASVVAMRTQPIPQAYRTFYRQIGLDPDTTRIPSEEAAVRRLLHGGFRSDGLIRDALLVALVETGVPVWALEPRCVDESGLGIRTTGPGERLGKLEQPLGAGRLVVADMRTVHAILFGAVAPGHEPDLKAKRVTLFAVGVPGVPAIHLEEALWTCQEILRAA